MKTKKLISLTIVLSLSINIAFFEISASDDTWKINTIDQGDESRIIGANPNIAIDDTNQIHIVYRETINQTSHILKYATRTDDKWNISIIPTNGSSDYISFTLDSNNKPHIAYREVNNLLDWKLVYTTLDKNNQWTMNYIDDSEKYIIGAHSSIIVDSNNNPHISYYEGLAHDLRYATINNGKWMVQKVDYEKNVGIYTSIALTSSNHPRITYIDRDTKDLKYASWDGSTWNFEVIDQYGNVGEASSLALDENDNPHVSYHDANNNTIKYAYKNENAWHIEEIDSNNVLSSSTSLALDKKGLPHIAYFDQSISENEYWLKYAVKAENGSWHVMVLSNEILGLYTSLKLDQNDNPHIAYLADYSLKYAEIISKNTQKNDAAEYFVFLTLFSIFVIVFSKKKIKK